MKLQHFKGKKIQNPSLHWNANMGCKDEITNPACGERGERPTQPSPQQCGQLEFMGQAHTDWFSVSRRCRHMMVQLGEEEILVHSGRSQIKLLENCCGCIREWWCCLQSLVLLGTSWQAMGHSVVPHAVLFSVVKLCIFLFACAKAHKKFRCHAD